MPTKLDHRKLLKHLYSGQKTKPVMIDVAPMNYLMLNGKGRPSEPEFGAAASTLYPVAYTLKFMVRAQCDIDYHVMPLEVLWRVNRQTKDFAWTMLLMQPDLVTEAMYAEAVSRVQAKKCPPLLSQLRFERLAEGMCVQLLHVGPYQGMDAGFEQMVAFAGQNGYVVPVRNTHDIYLNDSRKAKPENLRAIMRVAVQPQQTAN
jgi:hypothetical protein